MNIKDRVLEFILENNKDGYTKEELKETFGFKNKNEVRAFYKVLKDMAKEGSLVLDGEIYRHISETDYIVGELQGHDRGFGFLIPEDKELADVFISPNNMLNAFSGDRVMGKVTKESKNGRSREGEILRVIERKNNKIVGTFQKNKSFGFVVPDDKAINYDVFIPKADINGAKDKQKVVVEISKWPTMGRNPEGRVVEVLGYLTEKGTDILSIIRQFDLPYEFPEEVLEEVSMVNTEVTEDELTNRYDIRDLTTFTIDGFDAKDLDDAITIDRLDNGNFELGVHIADVSYYVKEKSKTDLEAFERGNSVYLIDRVVPMLPKELSNGICSLNQGVDRLCLSVFMEIDRYGNVVSHKVKETVINSDRRLVYDHVSDFLEEGSIDQSIVGLEEKLLDLKNLMDALIDKRSRRGSIDFDFPETKIILDENGKADRIEEEERRVGNKIIEECMIVCNETIAESMYWTELPFLYRVHEEPNLEKINEFNRFIHNFGYLLKVGEEVHPKELQKLSKEIRGKKEENLINMLMLRSMKKAKYSDSDEGHFGLASEHYTHFTAPIRRYADLEIHRIVKMFINGRLGMKKQEKLENFLPKVADHTSKTERKAELAEREVHDLKKAEYMSDRLGEEYVGIVSSLTNFGIFVQLENTVEGLVRYKDMRDDFYDFDEDNYIVRGERYGMVYNLGDPVRIRVVGTDLDKRTIDFKLLDKED